MKQISIVKIGAIDSLDSILSGLNTTRLFLVRGKDSFTKSGADKILLPLFKRYSVVEFNSFSTNPKINEAEIGLELFMESNSNVIICVGGGSVIDMGKIIKYLYCKRTNLLEQAQKTVIIAIPTTAGTGSEATRFAVVYVDGTKQSFDEEYLLPDFAIVDAQLLSGQSSYQMAVSGIDAFAQGIESYWNINSCQESHIYAEQGFKLIWENLKKAIDGDFDARIKISEGSFFAGKAINLTRTTAPHALSYGFTSKYGLPHGHAVALFLPFFIYYHKNLTDKNCCDPRGSHHTKNQMIKISEILQTNLESLEHNIFKFIQRCGINICLQNLNILENDFYDTLNFLNLERLKNNPGKVNTDLFKEIYKFNNELCGNVIN